METQNHEAFGKVKTRSTSFYFAHILIFIFFVLIVNTDMAQYSQHKVTGIPRWFSTLIFSVDALIVIGLLLQFLFKKVGVFIFLVFAVLHQLLYEFYLSTTLYAGLFLLFVEITAGLLVIIPRWKFYK